MIYDLQFPFIFTTCETKIITVNIIEKLDMPVGELNKLLHFTCIDIHLCLRSWSPCCFLHPTRTQERCRRREIWELKQMGKFVGNVD